MAGFNTAITGLKAASTNLDVTGNNIANSSTIGFKSSRTEFGDIYATAVVGAGSSNVAGSGVTVTDIAQDFQAGTIEFTNNNLDLAINGSGFFQLDDGQGSVTYTRAGSFELDKDGTIVSKSGKFLQGYGLDSQGNRLPIGNLAVTQKESPPKATEDIDLQFNINDAEDATLLTFPYDKDIPSSFTYSTTVRTFDSLGNEHTIKYNMVERRPTRDVYSVATASNAVRISGVTVDPTDGFSAGEVALIEAADPRIDSTSLNYTAGVLSFEMKAGFSDYGTVVIEDVSGPAVNITPSPTERDANEVRTYDLAVPAAADSPGTIDVAGVSIVITDTMTELDMANTIAAREAAIKDANPAVESISVVDAGGGNYQLDVRFKAEQGNINPSSFVITSSYQVAAVDGMNQVAVVEGDNSFQGKYRMYAYLNGTEQLDLGKVQDPGESGAAAGNTEVGPILLDFNPSSGLLQAINGVSFAIGAAAPEVTISGADPANPSTTVSLDLTGSTQFASASIVKSSSQDGYTKGDLIGVSFAETGEMVASFSNGQDQNLGVVAFATFENQSGLQPSGDTEWTATLDSGSAILNPPGTGLNGNLRSAALEQSNVDLSTELVRLIEAQRNFQANSKTLETLNTVTQSILQI